MPEPTEITADSLARIYIRAQDEAGHWGNVNLKEATDAQFDAWARSKITIEGEGDWSEKERVDFANFINTKVQQLVMVPE